MLDRDCVLFLQWALPRLHLRWDGFRRVRRQVRKRLARRLSELGLESVHDYRDYLAAHQTEWPELDRLCRITISRFYRDRALFGFLQSALLPELAAHARGRGADAINVWSAGCASGEEPYGLVLLWRSQLAQAFPDLGFRVVATDVDPVLLERARRACYPEGCLKDLPADLREAGFTREPSGHLLRSEFRQGIDFVEEDIRVRQPAGPFDLVACRNLVFTYFDESLQERIGTAIGSRLVPGGALVLGACEQLPEAIPDLEPRSLPHRVWCRQPARRNFSASAGTVAAS